LPAVSNPSEETLILLIFCLSTADDLTEAAVSLSAARLAGMAATFLEIFQLEPVVAQQQPEFHGPRCWTL